MESSRPGMEAAKSACSLPLWLRTGRYGGLRGAWSRRCHPATVGQPAGEPPGSGRVVTVAVYSNQVCPRASGTCWGPVTLSVVQFRLLAATEVVSQLGAQAGRCPLSVRVEQRGGGRVLGHVDHGEHAGGARVALRQCG